MHRLLFIWILILGTGTAFAQDLASPKFVLFGGGGVTNLPPPTRGSVHLGADFEEAPPVSDRVPYGILFEGGYITPAKSFSSGSAIFSADYMGAFALKDSPIIPFFAGGYSRLFGTGNAVNYGGGADFLLNGHKLRALRLEVRDYCRFSGNRHNFGFRVGYIFYIPD